MLHKYFKLEIVVLFLLGALLVAFFTVRNSESEMTSTVRIGDDTLTLIEARTIEEQEIGLSGRQSLGKYDGMIFYFDPPRETTTFWMKDMQINLDMAWISDGNIVQIDRNVPFPKEGENPERRMSPTGYFIDAVIEVGAQRASGWNVGDTVHYGY